MRIVPLLMFLAGLAACQTDTPPAAVSPASSVSACSVSRVIDGDTVDMRCNGRGTIRTRLMGFDTPETYKPGCANEFALGQQAKARLSSLVRVARTTDVRFNGTDRYGRALGQLSLDGVDVAKTLVSEGLAVRYSGGRRINWCQRLAAL